nr:MAG TPA: antitoxin [Caudoviricetes sp.]
MSFVNLYGFSHTVYTTLPRHNEIPNNFAKKILKDLGIIE